jgi:hypothetical protein
MFEHARVRRALPLLAAGALPAPARERILAHLPSCPSCARELEELRSLLDLLAQDPVRRAEPPLALDLLLARVAARLDEGHKRSRPAAPGRLVFASLAVAAAVVVAVLAFFPAGGGRPRGERPLVSEDTFRRLERNLAREQAARYLGEAQDVLVSVAAAQDPCNRGTVDVGEASERSRELLTRRALLADPEGAAVASVRPVLDEVEQALREVASLESCVRPRDVERVREDLARHQLLMRIRLMKRELEG